MDWIIIILIALFIIGQLQKSSAAHPLNQYSGVAPSSAVSSQVGASSGDTFSGSTQTIAAGIPQPQTGMKTTVKTSGLTPIRTMGVTAPPPHSVFPIAAPPPIAIQRPIVTPIAKPIAVPAPTPVFIGRPVPAPLPIVARTVIPRYRGY